MLLSNRPGTFSIPHTSKCVIMTTGLIKDGDAISITSPIFSSTNFISNEINMSDQFDVVVKLRDPSNPIENDNNNGQYMEGTLVCDDDDVFNMYVRI